MLRCLIIDDERPARHEMRRMLSIHADIEIVGEAANVRTALELFHTHRPEVVFLDVQLQRETGFDFIAQVEGPQPHTIFVTAHDQYAIRGFECNALDYLLKPVRPERLATALDRLRKQQAFHSPATLNDMVFLRIGTTARFVPWRSVHRVTTEGDYTRVFLSDGVVGLILRPLKEWLELAPTGLLIRVHRQTLIRPDSICEIQLTSNGRRTIVLTDGITVAVGRRYWPDLKKLLGT